MGPFPGVARHLAHSGLFQHIINEPGAIHPALSGISRTKIGTTGFASLGQAPGPGPCALPEDFFGPAISDAARLTGAVRLFAGLGGAGVVFGRVKKPVWEMQP